MIRSRLAAALAAFDPIPTESPPASALDRSLTLVGLLLLVIPLSGATLVITGLGLVPALALTFALVLGWAALVWPYLGRRKLPAYAWLAAALFFAAVGWFCWRELWNPFFEGFPGMGGGDGGNHIALGHAVEAGHAEVYQGMAALSATALWIERLFHADAFVAYRTVFYLVIASVVGFVAVMSALGGGRRAPIVLVLVSAIAAYPATRSLLPLLHYYQCDGYWSQLLGLVPIFVGIGMYATCERRLFRLVALGFMIGFYRFTYLLNVSDLAIAACILAAWEAVSLRGRLALVLRGGAILGVAGAIYLYTRLYAIAHLTGGIVQDDPRLTAAGTAVLSFLLLGSPVGFRLARIELPAAARRLFLAAGSFGALVAAATLAYAWADGKKAYYYVKYPLAGAVVAGATASIMLALFVAGMVDARRRVAAWLVLLPILLVGAGGDVMLARGATPYRSSYLERAGGQPPWHDLNTQKDPEVWRDIEQTLQGRRRFGGLLTPNWPESQLTNAAFGLPLFFIDPFHAGQIVDWPRTCVFWEPGGWAKVRMYSTAVAEVRRLGEDTRSTCHEYSPEFDPHQRQQICHLCIPDVTIDVPLSDTAWSTLTGFWDTDREFAKLGRWTNGHATVSLRGVPLIGHCALRLATGNERTLHVTFDGAEVTEKGGVYPLPPIAATRTDHEIELVSKTSGDQVPDPATAPRRLGVKVRKLSLECDLP